MPDMSDFQIPDGISPEDVEKLGGTEPKPPLSPFLQETANMFGLSTAEVDQALEKAKDLVLIPRSYVLSLLNGSTMLYETLLEVVKEAGDVDTVLKISQQLYVNAFSRMMIEQLPSAEGVEPT